MDGLKRFSSIRCVPAETTLHHAQSHAQTLGISRVTDIARLDRIGLPVYASVRPRSQSNTVTYGKGLLPIDAQVGAYMEAIEFQYAEPDSQHGVQTQWGTPRDLTGAEEQEDTILNYCPIANRKAELDEPLLLAKAEEIETGKSAWIPAELVFHPAPNVGQRLFGSSSNGLASGNSVLEATVHALTEVIERDVWSFQFLKETAQTIHFRLNSPSLPQSIQTAVQQAQKHGMEFIVRHVSNAYGLPFFCAYLYDQKSPSEKYFNGGWGCHHHKNIAFVRAICEAAQSRAAIIHGGRNFGEHNDDPQMSQAILERVKRMKADREKHPDYDELPDLESDANLEQQLELLIACIRKVTDHPIYRVVYTPPHSPLQVVRLLVPTLESFRKNHMRLGRRFQAAMEVS